MILSTNKKFIFAHNPKTGGTSLRQALTHEIRPLEQSKLFKVIRRIESLADTYPFYDFLHRRHTTLFQASLLLPNHIFSDCFKFGIVRDPFEWAFSVYRHFLTHCRIYPSREYLISRELPSFSEFAISLRNVNLVPFQSYAFINKAGEFIGDSLGYFNCLETYIGYLSKRIDVDINLLHLNQSKVNNVLPLTYSDKKLIEDVWGYDFDFFGDYEVDDDGQVILSKTNLGITPDQNLKDYNCWKFLRSKNSFS